MTDVTGIIGSGVGVTPTQPVSAPAAPSSNALQNPASEPAASPRFVNNPLAGTVVTQYLSNAGHVVSQFPSTAAVAYLQEGLTAQGFSKTSKTTVA